MNGRPGLLLLGTDPNATENLIVVQQRLQAEVPDVSVLLATSIDLFRGFSPIEGRWDEIAQVTREEFGLEPSLLYRSDQDYMNGVHSEEEMIQRTLFCLRRADRLFSDHDVRFLFLGGGGSLVGNAFFELAQRRGIYACRAMDLSYFNLQDGLNRYFFCPNNLSRIPHEIPIDRLGPRFEAALEHSRRYVASVKSKELPPDRFARASATRNHYTPTTMGLIRSAANYAMKSVVSLFDQNRGRSRGIDRDKVISYFRKAYVDLTRVPLELDGNYFVFVLHHPRDSQLTFRGRHFSDQMALCRILASNLPVGSRLLSKEHPVYPGMMPVSDIRRLRKLYKNVDYADYSVPFPSVVKGAKAVITINSTAGIEAMIYGVPVICLGECYYRGEPFVYTVDYMRDLTPALVETLTRPKRPSESDVVDLVARLLYHTEPEPLQEQARPLDYLVDGIRKRVTIRTATAN